MPSAVLAAEGIEVDRPQTAVRSITMPKSTEMRCSEHNNASEPWQSWPLTARYLLVRLAQAVPSAVLLWLAYAHR
jgi:hypothetical protein